MVIPTDTVMAMVEVEAMEAALMEAVRMAEVVTKCLTLALV